MSNAHIPCTNTLRKVMIQLPLTAKGVTSIEATKDTQFQQICAFNVLQMPVARSVTVD